MSISDHIHLLEYKKQIILQGPPGTGKTRLAKELADEVTIPDTITDQDILNTLNIGDTIKSGKDYVSYNIKGYDNDNILLINESGNPVNINLGAVIAAFRDRTWLSNQITNGALSAAAGLAKYIYHNCFKDQTVLIQFHPSYTYEDFVRGIVVESNNGNIEYNTQNKILGEFAQRALDNYNQHMKPAIEISRDNWLREQFDLFKEEVQEIIDEKGSYKLTDNVSIIEIDENSFRYKGKTWDIQGSHKMHFKDVINGYKNEIKSRQELKNDDSVSGSAKQHASYFIRVIEAFRNSIKSTAPVDTKPGLNELKNYVLIIDEINRANLPSVLGELIYALEYRGKAVKSIYKINKEADIILPPNLFIIGTLNTADRSVGQIDYAIRRRFAFVEVLPKALQGNFDLSSFKQVSSLFIKNTDEYLTDEKIMLETSEHLAEEFRAEDVWLGHSYFITNEAPIDIRLKYEIIPILKEYMKDGILKSSAKEIINALAQ